MIIASQTATHGGKAAIVVLITKLLCFSRCTYIQSLIKKFHASLSSDGWTRWHTFRCTMWAIFWYNLRHLTCAIYYSGLQGVPWSLQDWPWTLSLLCATPATENTTAASVQAKPGLVSARPSSLLYFIRCTDFINSRRKGNRIDTKVVRQLSGNAFRGTYQLMELQSKIIINHSMSLGPTDNQSMNSDI